MSTSTRVVNFAIPTELPPRLYDLVKGRPDLVLGSLTRSYGEHEGDAVAAATDAARALPLPDGATLTGVEVGAWQLRGVGVDDSGAGITAGAANVTLTYATA